VVEKNRPQALLGTHEHTIDDKNRLTLPAKFRESFAEGVFIKRSIEKCLDVYRREDWFRQVESRLAALDPLSKEARKLQRYQYSTATEADLDKQGRVTIPAHLLEYAGLKRDVIVAGTGDRLEIWDRETWRRELAEVEGSAEDVAERLAAKSD
jgi:MraZ protein